MAINMCCMNDKCKFYFEQMCQKNVNEEFMVIGENGKCEAFKEGKSDWYKDCEGKDMNETRKAVPTYDKSLGAWIILFPVEGRQSIPLGRTIVNAEDTLIFEYSKFDSRMDAQKWIEAHSDKFYYEASVRFYAFNDYEYFALIAVDAEEKYPMAVAIEAYKEEVADIEESEKDSTPDEISFDKAFEIYKKSDIEGCGTETAKIINFYERIDLDTEHEQDYEIMLIDGSLF